MTVKAQYLTERVLKIQCLLVKRAFFKHLCLRHCAFHLLNLCNSLLQVGTIIKEVEMQRLNNLCSK